MAGTTRIARLAAKHKVRVGKYALVSAVSVATGQVALVALFYFAHWQARPANIASCIAGGIPSYYMNRRWVWGKSGRSAISSEVAPFWILTFVGLAASTWLAGFAATYGEEHFDSRAVQTALVSAASLFAFGTLWILKFVVFERFLFRTSATRRG